MTVAPLLPESFTKSAWPDLGPTARLLFLEEILVANPDLVVEGTVDYQSSREPVLLDTRNGVNISLAAEVVNLGRGLIVEVTEGTLQNSNLLLGLVVVALLGVSLLFRKG